MPSSNDNKLRPLPALALIVLCVTALLYLAYGSNLEGQQKVMARLTVLGLTGAGLFFWFTFLSGLTWRRRLQGMGALAFLLLLGAALFRFEGFTGNVAPILVPRWQAASTLVVDAASERAQEGDWPQFLGPGAQRRPVSQGPVLARTTGPTQPPAQVWRRPVGAGWSGFAVVGERAQLPRSRTGEGEGVVAYDLRTGEGALAPLRQPGSFRRSAGRRRAESHAHRSSMGAFLPCLRLDASTHSTSIPVSFSGRATALPRTAPRLPSGESVVRRWCSATWSWSMSEQETGKSPWSPTTATPEKPVWTGGDAEHLVLPHRL